MTIDDLGPLDWRIAITDKNGRPTPEFQRRWATQRGNNSQIPSKFTQLSDVPSSYTSAGGKLVRVNSEATGLEFDALTLVLDSLGATQGDILYRNATGWVVLAPGTVNQLLQTGGVSANPSWVNAPTGLPSSAAQGDLLYYNGTSWVLLAPGTSGYLLQTNGASANPTWVTPPSGLPSAVQGDILYYNGSNWVVLTPGTSGYVLQTGGSGANPSWVAQTGGLPSAVQGDILYYNGSSWVVLTPGTSGQVLTTGGASANPSWTTVSGGGGGGGSTPTVRGYSSQTSSASSYTVTFPSGSASGDLAIIMGTHGYVYNTPSGWSVLDTTGSAGFINGQIFFKTLTSADITAGSVTVTSTGVYDGSLIIITFIGATVGPTPVLGSSIRNTSGGSSQTLTLNSVPAGSYPMYFSGVRGNVTITCNVGSSLQTTTDSANACAVLYGNGTPGSPTYSYSPSAPYYYCAALYVVPVASVLPSGVRGDILYYGASGWAALATGTSGQVLQTNGASADPTWVTPSSASAPFGLLTSGDTGPGIMDDHQGQSILINLGTSAPYRSVKLKNYLFVATVATLPASPNLPSGASAIAYCTDVSKCRIWNPNTNAWVAALG